MKVKILLSVLIIFLSSCSGTGGTIGGLFPAPKFLDGKVENDTYYSAEGAFSVSLPHPPTNSKDDKYEWTYTKIHEIKDKEVIGIVIGPAAFDLNIYHAVLVRTPMQVPKDEYVANVFSKKVKSRADQFVKQKSMEFDLNGKKCFYSVYESTNGFLVLSLTDNGDSFYVVEADISKKSWRGGTNLEQLVSRQWEIFNNMLNSFTVIKSKG